MPSEERVMRAREVLAETPHADDCRYIMAVREGDEDAHYVDCTCDRAIRAMLAFSDEGSGIGELREAANLVFCIEAAGAIQYEGTNFERWKAKAREIAPNLRAAFAASTLTSAADRRVGTDPLAIRCPRCKAPIGSRCATIQGKIDPPHDERFAALDVPDIDRSELAQEVGQSRADQLLADDLDYVAGKPVE